MSERDNDTIGLRRDLERAQQRLDALAQLSDGLVHTVDLPTLFRRCTTAARQLFSFDFSTLMLLMDDGEALRIEDTIGFPEQMIGTFRLVHGHGLSTHVVRQGRAACVPEFAEEKRFEVPPVVFKMKIRSAMCVPMMLEDTVFGVLIGHTLERREFSDQEILAYQEIANRGAVAIMNARHAAETTRLRSLLKSMIDSMPSLIAGLDDKGKVTHLNRGGEELCGASARGAQGKLIGEVLPQLARLPEVLQAVSEGERLEYSQTCVLEDGRSIFAEVKVFPLEQPGGGAVLRIDDVSDRVRVDRERAQLEARLRDSQRVEAVGTLAGGVAHDLNNILGGIMGFAELARLGTPEGTPTDKDLQEVLAAATRARGIVGQILAFGRRSRQSLSSQRLQNIVAEVLKLLRASIPSTVEMCEELDPRCPPVLADPTQIHQVLVNLCTNAHQAMSDGGRISIALAQVDATSDPAVERLPKEDYVRLSVGDTGCGMAPETLERIYDPYFTTRELGGGTGLGLSVVHGIVRSHGGHITATSSIGEGTTFFVYLPVASSSHLSRQEEHATGLPRGNEHVMVVDDEPLLRQSMSRQLEALGYRTCSYEDGPSAYEAFRHAPDAVDIVLTDMTMPKMVGTALARAMLRLRPELPVILYTGYTDLVSEEQCHELGLAGFLKKPVKREELAHAIRDALDEARRRVTEPAKESDGHHPR